MDDSRIDWQLKLLKHTRDSKQTRLLMKGIKLQLLKKKHIKDHYYKGCEL